MNKNQLRGYEKEIPANSMNLDKLLDFSVPQFIC